MSPGCASACASRWVTVVSNAWGAPSAPTATRSSTACCWRWRWFLAEATGLSAPWVVGLGWASLAARLAHAAGFLRLGPPVVRTAMVATYALEVGLSVYLLSRAFR